MVCVQFAKEEEQDGERRKRERESAIAIANVGFHYEFSNTKYMCRTWNELALTVCHLMIVTNEPTSEPEPISAYQGATEMTVERSMASDEQSDVYASESLAQKMYGLIVAKLNSHHRHLNNLV